ncbi:MAG TPA: hypothetical protein VMW50_13535 [Dehalococcoidia bacterium]|nr:hypothetical protein [Dehalococcoidia bacterium]
MTEITDRPLADKGLTSYRYKGMFGWIMIGAKHKEDALEEAARSVCGATPVTADNLQVWNGKKYIPVDPVDHDDFEQILLNKLPHGSGFDCKWEFTWLKNGKVKAKNYFHCMNEHGYYDGYAPFTLIIDPAKCEDFKLVFNGRTGQNKNRQYMLREYIEDNVGYALTTESV